MNKHLVLIISFILISSLLLFSCHSEKKAEKLNIFAATSLKDVLSKTAELYTNKTGIKLSLNFASSGLLARQIEQGAEVDFFFSANQDWMKYILDKNLLKPSSKLELAENRMVLIVPIGSGIKELQAIDASEFPSLMKGRLAVGDPEHVPAGKYAKEILNHYKLWSQFEKRLLPCKNARETLLMVEMGEVDMGIVYLSDAKKSNKVRCIYEFPEASSSPILYYSAHRTNPDSMIRDFQKFLRHSESKRIWKEYAFIVHD